MRALSLSLLALLVLAASAFAAPVLNQPRRFVQPKEWVYINGQFNETDKIVLSYSNGQTVEAGIYLYNNQSGGFTVPENPPAVTATIAVRAKSSDSGAGGVSQAYDIAVGVPAGKPNGISLYSFNTRPGCYNYVDGSNFFVSGSKITLSANSDGSGEPQVSVGVTAYNSNQMGFTVPNAALGLSVSGKVFVTVTTPLGKATSERPMIVNNGTSNGFC